MIILKYFTVYLNIVFIVLCVFVCIHAYTFMASAALFSGVSADMPQHTCVVRGQFAGVSRYLYQIGPRDEMQAARAW